MIVKRKAYFLKKDVPMSELEKFGFVTLNGGCSYCKLDELINTKNDLYRLICYSDNRIIKLKALSYCWTIRVKKYIHDLIEANLVYKKNYYYVVTWRRRGSNKWSEAKIERITKKISRLQDTENRKEVEE